MSRGRLLIDRDFGVLCDQLMGTETEFLDEIQTKVLRVFLLVILSHLYSFALRYLFLQTHAASYSFYNSVSVQCKGERRKTWKITIFPSLLFMKFIQNLKSENSQDYAQKPQQNCTFINSASGMIVKGPYSVWSLLVEHYRPNRQTFMIRLPQNTKPFCPLQREEWLQTLPCNSGVSGTHNINSN